MCEKIISGIKKRPVNLFILILVCCLYYLNNHCLKIQSSGIIQLFFICYFNDLMAPMFLMSYSNILALSGNREITKLWQITGICVSAGCVWEYVAPYFKKGAVADPIDLICYIIGGSIYWILVCYCKGGKKYCD